MNDEKYKYSILYVEDDEAVRSNYVAYLSRFFEEVYEAADAESAYEIYKEKKPDILVVDIILPGRSGIDFLRDIREYDHSTRAIMLTALSDVETLVSASELKLTKYLIKPISRDELKEAFEMAVDEIVNYTTYSNRLIHIKESCYWDQDKEKLIYHDKEIFLTRKERELLSLLFSNIHRVFKSEEIIFELWYDFDNSKISSLKTLVKTLRKKLPEGTIKNVFGIGYTIEL
ncbi:response regulator transcription factor [Sulfurimonas sp.]